MPTILELDKEINKIKERNAKVEEGKAWETSWTRKIVIASLTYVTISSLLLVSGFPKPLQSAIVPTIGFILSTLSLPLFRNLWKKYIYKK